MILSPHVNNFYKPVVEGCKSAAATSSEDEKQLKLRIFKQIKNYPPHHVIHELCILSANVFEKVKKIKYDEKDLKEFCSEIHFKAIVEIEKLGQQLTQTKDPKQQANLIGRISFLNDKLKAENGDPRERLQLYLEAATELRKVPAHAVPLQLTQRIIGVAKKLKNLKHEFQGLVKRRKELEGSLNGQAIKTEEHRKELDFLKSQMAKIAMQQAEFRKNMDALKKSRTDCKSALNDMEQV